MLQKRKAQMSEDKTTKSIQIQPKGNLFVSGPLPRWVVDKQVIGSHTFPKVSCQLSARDTIGAWKVRWGFDRMSYTIQAGLYAIGNPGDQSPVFVTANYKMSFDRLRSNLGRIDGWILVLDTKGVNVWCAAGKGTFGTNELIFRLIQSRLPEIVSHRIVIIPQLGATGICAHEVKHKTGFKVLFGPVRASDIPGYMSAGMNASPEMRRVTFPMKDRIVLAPVEIVNSLWKAILVTLVLTALSGIEADNLFSADRLIHAGLTRGLGFFGAFLWGAVMTPVLLPWLPGKPFALKGLCTGILYCGLLSILISDFQAVTMEAIGGALLILAACSYQAMNFTGSSTYTSLSGVLKEMKYALPAQISLASAGIIVWTIGLFI